MENAYDRIGVGYSKHRCADPRLVDALTRALALAPPAVLADIGAGTGNYSRAMADRGFHIEAVEPSPVMRKQAVTHPLVAWRRGTAEAIPLGDDSVDGVFCILASHHFGDLESGVSEMARICRAGPIVWFTLDPRREELPWLRNYFPELHEQGLKVFRPLEEVCHLLEARAKRQITAIPWPVPNDLQDCFWAAGWRRPEMYLDPEIRASISLFALADPAALADGLSMLERDLADGTWRAKYGAILQRQAIDWGYRLLIAS